MARDKKAAGPDIFKKDLLDNETIQWIGQPDTKKIFNSADFLLIPLGLFPVIFSFVWIALSFKYPTSIPRAAVVALGLIPLVIGLYLSFIRLVFKRRKRRVTFYAVTDKRILVVSTGKRRSIRTKRIEGLSDIGTSVNSDGSGTIFFGRPSRTNFLDDSGLNIFSPFCLEDSIAFRDIGDVAGVQSIVEGLVKKTV